MFRKISASAGLRPAAVRPAERVSFRYPLRPYPKVAIICDALQAPEGCISLPEHLPFSSSGIQAETLALPASLLSSLPRSWKPSFPLVVFTGTRYGFMGEEEREAVWRKYAVPVFEQLLDENGRVLAVECEAHSGLHIEPGYTHAVSSGELIIDGSPISVSAEGVLGLCGCGRPDPRITVGALPALRPVLA